jgi:type I restriction enzyme S subunit
VQIAIAFYLDQKTAQIDRIIANKQRLIAHYEEEKQAIINQAVTKGLDPNVLMKSSGVEWLGDIPEHWEVKRLKYLVTKIGSGITPTGGASVYQTSGIPLLRSQNIYFDGLKLEDVAYISEEVDDNMRNSRLQEGDVLLNITGGSIGRCYYVPKDFGKGNVNQHVCIIRPKNELIETKHLYFILRSIVGQLQIDLLQTGANREGLNFEQLKNFAIPIMDVCEQELIVKSIESKIKEVDFIIDKLKRQIDLFQEYRTTLISEVVTGKVKVPTNS